MSDHATMTTELPTETLSRGSLHAVVMPLSERVANYHRVTGFPESLFVGGDGRIVGTWIMGNDYRVKSEYYGGYPAGYLRRVKALFPDKQRVLHLFSGRVDKTVMPGDTVDVNPELAPDYVDDAQTLARVPLETYDLVMADPPYSVEDCEHYGTTMVKRNKVMAALGARLTPGCHVVWLDQVLPMYRKDQFQLEAVIGMVKSTNHRFRVVTVFKRHNAPDQRPPVRCIRLVKPRRPTAYDRDQHDLICKALKVSNDPNAPGDTAYEAVCKVLYRQDMALAAKTLAEAKKALRIKPGTMGWIPLYGTGEA